MESKTVRIVVGTVYLLTAAYHSLGIIWFGIQDQPLIASIPMLIIIIGLVSGALFPYGKPSDANLTKSAITTGILGAISCVVVGVVWWKEGGVPLNFAAPLIWAGILLTVFAVRAYRQNIHLATE